jgi:hypothetical protein
MAIDIEYFFVMQFIYAHQILTHANLVFGLKTQKSIDFDIHYLQIKNHSSD